MRDERKRTRRLREENQSVLDDKVNGKVKSLANEFKHLEHKVKNYDTSISKNSNKLMSLVMGIAESERVSEKKGNKELDEDKAKRINKKISRALKNSLGHNKGEKIAEKFEFQAKEYGIEKASKNLVKEVYESTRRHSGRKIGAFARKTGALSRKSTRSSIRRVRQEEKAEKRLDEHKKEAIKVGGREGQKLASVIDRQMMKSKGNSKEVSAQIKKLRDKEPQEKKVEKAIEKQVKLIGARDVAIRRLRRNARKIKSVSKDIRNIDMANNGIELNNRGDEAAEGLRRIINSAIRFADRGASLSTRSISQDKAQSQSMMIDALLQKGRANMMAAQRRTNVMKRSLVQEQQLNQDRVRS